jgi:enoyl-CoA hydratase/carnithine racemase
MSTMSLIVERCGPIVTLTVSRPARLNAFRRDDYAALRYEIARLAGHEDVRAVILTGAGRAFCAGETVQDITRLIVPSQPVYIAGCSSAGACQSSCRRRSELSGRRGCC